MSLQSSFTVNVNIVSVLATVTVVNEKDGNTSAGTSRSSIILPVTFVLGNIIVLWVNYTFDKGNVWLSLNIET